MIDSLRLTTGSSQQLSLETAQTYDNEGKVLTVKYPDAYGQNLQGSYGTQPGPTYTYGMGRPIQLTDNQPSPATWVNNVQYGPAISRFPRRSHFRLLTEARLCCIAGLDDNVGAAHSFEYGGGARVS